MGREEGRAVVPVWVRVNLQIHWMRVKRLYGLSFVLMIFEFHVLMLLSYMRFVPTLMYSSGVPSDSSYGLWGAHVRVCSCAVVL